MILIVFNTVNRPQIMRKTIRTAIQNSGVNLTDVIVSATNNGGGAKVGDEIEKLRSEVDVFSFSITINQENLGNSAMLNRAIRICPYNKFIDYIAVLGDDLTMPDNWLKDAIDKHEELNEKGIKTGLCGFHPFTGAMLGEWNEELGVYTREAVFGCWVFPKKLIDIHGYFLALSKYGRWDGEYGLRLNRSGRQNFSLKNYKAAHLGSDVGQNTPYRKMKNEQLKLAGERMKKYFAYYGERTYVPIHQTEWNDIYA